VEIREISTKIVLELENFMANHRRIPMEITTWKFPTFSHAIRCIIVVTRRVPPAPTPFTQFYFHPRCYGRLYVKPSCAPFRDRLSHCITFIKRRVASNFARDFGFKNRSFYESNFELERVFGGI
jgi:hypothetical protein